MCHENDQSHQKLLQLGLKFETKSCESIGGIKVKRSWPLVLVLNEINIQTKKSFFLVDFFSHISGAPVAFKTWWGHQYMVGIICLHPLVGIGLRMLPIWFVILLYCKCFDSLKWARNVNILHWYIHWFQKYLTQQLTHRGIELWDFRLDHWARM